MATLYGLKNCDTCRKAMKTCSKLTLVDVRGDGVPDDTLQAAFETFGNNLLNTRSTTWRGLSDSDKARPPLDLIRDHPALMKRPLIAIDQSLFLGWSKDTEAAVIAAL